ncbi:amino acid adenylation domain-containing protein [Myxococcota bacterium]|nr:amino acid adenylation domain-containing protein [Myxococcota bacterium]
MDVRARHRCAIVLGDRRAERYNHRAAAAEPTLDSKPPDRRARDRQQALEILKRRREATRAPKIPRVPRDGALPLSFSEQRLWLLERLEGDSGVHHIPMAWRWSGPLDDAALAGALDALVRRHEALRTSYPVEDGRPVRRIAPITPIAALHVERISLTHLDGPSREEALRVFVSDAARRRFDLANGPLFRAQLLALGPEEHVLAIQLHHIVFDGWSLGVLRRELAALYDAFRRGAPSPLAEPPIQYADFAAWQRARLTPEALAPQLDFWTKTLAGAPPRIELPADHPRPQVQRFRGRRLPFALGADVSRAVVATASELQATPFMVLLAAWSALLGRHAGEEDVVIGSPIANRTELDTEGVVGCFINTIVLRTRPIGSLSFRAFVDAVRRTAIDAYSNQDLPFEQLIEHLSPERSLAHAPVFQVMFILQNAPEGAVPPGLVERPVEPDTRTTMFDLTLMLEASPSGFVGAIEWDVDRFDAATVERLAARLRALITSAVASPDTPLGALELLPPEEQTLLLHTLNATSTPIVGAQTIHEAFELVSRAHPDRIAVEARGEQLAYGALDARARAIAAALRVFGPGARVGVALDRGVDLVAALLGVLGAGAAYVPLDPALPAARLALITEDAGLSAIVTAPSITLPAVDVPRVDVTALVPSDAPLDAVDPGAIAYVLYTSGSTGRPKGVEIPHRAVVSFLASMRHELGFGADDVLLAVTTVSFDIAGLELFLPLTTGARVVVASREVAADPRALARAIESSRATFLQATPATWRRLVDGGWRGSDRLTILCGGEALPLDLARALAARGRAAFNLYGPTETTIWSTIERLDPAALAASDARVTVGRPIANTEVYVLDAARRLAPLGVEGELFIGGIGLACGYLGRPELTAQAFVPHPFARELGLPPDARVYATGDRARRLASGVIELLGRRDGQVKVRGFRVELGEVEATLRSHADVVDAAVIVRAAGTPDARLVAFVVATDGVTIDAAALRTFVARELPEHMIPAPITIVDALPRTPNGKLDRLALAARAIEAPARREPSVPKNATERRLAALFAEVLGLRSVSPDDGFFTLGGHSLLAVTLADRIEATFGRVVPLMAIFQAPTVRGLAALLDAGARPELSVIEPIQPEGARPPLFFIGSTLYARRLADRLGRDQPMYGLNVFGLERPDRTRLEVSEIADVYLAEIRAIEPRGPYRIAAYCADAKLALELAHRLKVGGEPIALLAFVDTIWPGDQARGVGLRALALNLLEYRGAYVRHRVKRRVRRVREQLTELARTVDGRRHALLGTPLPIGVRHARFVRAYLDALARHPSSPYDGRVVVFLSHEMRHHSPEELGRLVRTLDVREVPGFHDEVFSPPNVDALARSLDEELVRALA